MDLVFLPFSSPHFMSRPEMLVGFPKVPQLDTGRARAGNVGLVYSSCLNVAVSGPNKTHNRQLLGGSFLVVTLLLFTIQSVGMTR